MQENKFSFVIPTYNASLHIKRCLESIRGQDYPQENIEIIIADGGSSDNTLYMVKEFGCVVLNNPKKLAEYGVQLGVENATGNLIVVFAADNELVGLDWAKKVSEVFTNDPKISALWGRLASGKDDAALNKYFELIQSDPLNWFLNNNLQKYLKKADTAGFNCFVFEVDPKLPLVWGANGLVYRRERIKGIWQQQGYLGDNDAFQYMLEQGFNKVAYFNSAFVYHHHVARLSDWVKKWKRNFCEHFLSKQETRNMRWVFSGNFKLRLFFWSIYSSIPVFSFMHSVYLALRDKNFYWLYHSVVTFMQFFTYFFLMLNFKNSRLFLRNKVLLEG